MTTDITTDIDLPAAADIMTSIDADTGPTTTPPTTGPPPMDWDRGAYELTAVALAPAAEAVVLAGRVRPGQRVLDVGCGSGNAALIAARAGAQVTAVDPAPRLLDVARAQARREGLTIEVLPGEAASLPVPDRRFDAVLSNFTVILAPDPAAAVAEMVRVLAPDGRIVFSAWLPGGAVGQMNEAGRTWFDAPSAPRRHPLGSPGTTRARSSRCSRPTT